MSTSNLKRVLCLDLDGTVRRSKRGKQFISDAADVELFPGVEDAIRSFRRGGWAILGISNQGGVAHGFKTVAEEQAEIEATVRAFTNNPFHIIKSCHHDARGSIEPYCHRSLLRKPGYGMLAVAEADFWTKGNIIADWDRSLFVGDRPEDEECAKSAGIAFKWAWEFFGREAP